MDPGLRMHAERTPNPDSIKWVLGGGTVVAGGRFVGFSERPPPEVSPLAARLFEVAGVEGVFLGPDFVTVSKSEQVAWGDLAEPIVASIEAWVAAGEPALGEAWQAPARDEGDAVVERIREILEDEIRPRVAMDGGDVVFAGFHEGIVQVHLRGACVGCPSSLVTLKMGVEARLREEIPEVRSVVAV